ncbi:DNA ligase 1 [Manduca sexta]|uniref:RRM domain-containing protein n=1 Tax=Manduca sexta TaxID=7130 RepID=A0A922CIF4_MANSE|nr:DNA ligase 1 [Manduca sexta]XP_030022305.1 DNA ligase 1 [Manduca sexta]KAG6447305.1 hypothetical protein O3G_MSEX004834 [Manduca sexta]KAG6447306.1 hypothetical protein O3G_MSEX004834 [Manduca sexta]
MEKQPKLTLLKKRKRKSSTTLAAASEPKTLKIGTPETTIKAKTVSETKNKTVKQKKNATKITDDIKTMEDAFKKYPVLQDNELISKFRKVPLNNNQKGRIRQAINLQLKDSSAQLIPDIIHGKIQAILKRSKDLTDSEIRRVRILYNMLTTSVQKVIQKSDTESESVEPKTVSKEKKKKEKKVKVKVEGDLDEKENKEKKEQLVNKPRGPKRYVVFVGNLPLDIDKEKIMDHFSEINEQIKDVRLPKPLEGRKSAIAFIELSNEPSYEIALSKHHSMMGNKRINVLYTAQQNSKISKAEAKSKSAKLIALQKSGKLLGSVPLNKKRSQRRKKMKAAQAREAAASA